MGMLGDGAGGVLGGGTRARWRRCVARGRTPRCGSGCWRCPSARRCSSSWSPSTRRRRRALVAGLGDPRGRASRVCGRGRGRGLAGAPRAARAFFGDWVFGDWVPRRRGGASLGAADGGGREAAARVPRRDGRRLARVRRSDEKRRHRRYGRVGDRTESETGRHERRRFVGRERTFGFRQQRRALGVPGRFPSSSLRTSAPPPRVDVDPRARGGGRAGCRGPGRGRRRGARHRGPLRARGRVRGRSVSLRGTSPDDESDPGASDDASDEDARQQRTI